MYNCKPSLKMIEAPYKFIEGKLRQGNGEELFDGKESLSSSYETGYFYRIDHYVIIEVYTSFILHAYTNIYPQHNKRLKILKKENGKWVDKGLTFTRGTKPYVWVPLAEELPPGRYKFMHGEGYHIDTEWFLEATTLPSVYLLKQGKDLLTWKDNLWKKVDSEIVTEPIFKEYGFCLHEIPDEAWKSLKSDFYICSWQAQEFKNPTPLVVHYVPHPRLILPSGDISLSNTNQIEKISLKATESGSGVVRVIVSSDSGSTWKSWDGAAWAEVDHSNFPEVKEKGLTIEGINSLTSEEWGALVSGSDTIRFGYYLEQTELTDTAEIDEISATLQMKGSWKRCPSDDFDYEWKNDSLVVSLKKPGSFKVNYPVENSGKR